MSNYNAADIGFSTSREALELHHRDFVLEIDEEATTRQRGFVSGTFRSNVMHSEYEIGKASTLRAISNGLHWGACETLNLTFTIIARGPK